MVQTAPFEVPKGAWARLQNSWFLSGGCLLASCLLPVHAGMSLRVPLLLPADAIWAVCPS
jgi:hypothetical protein